MNELNIHLEHADIGRDTLNRGLRENELRGMASSLRKAVLLAAVEVTGLFVMEGCFGATAACDGK